MGIKVTGIREAKEQLRKLCERADNAILQALDEAGKRLVETALATKQYQNRTGNLSASMGYGVYYNGNEYSTGGFGGGDGETKGREYLGQIQSQYAQSKFALIVVAGMEYAAAVERKGYVVLDGALLRSDNIVKNELSKIKLL
ncbi:MAG: HK97 gp10 family phage protein [Prevotella sp.]|nr:HK97 gp10 family phage protein [Prevotella sp.]